MRFFLLILFIVITFLSFVSCNSLNVKSEPRQADLVVKLDGETIHSVGPTWTTYDELVDAVDNKNKNYILFATEWCTPCTKLLKIAKQEGWMDKIHVLNADLPWVQYLMKEIGSNSVPILLVVENIDGKESRTIYRGAAKIATYLVVQL